MSTTTAAPAAARALVWHLESGGWTVREIEHLRFLQSMVRTGRIAARA